MRTRESHEKIKFDRQTMMLLGILTVGGILLLAVGIFCAYVEEPGFELLFLFGVLGGGGLSLFCGSRLLAGRLYFARLARYGYEIPKKKSAYGNLVENLPRVGGSFAGNDPMNDGMSENDSVENGPVENNIVSEKRRGKNPESRILTWVFLGMYLLLILYNIVFWARWCFTEDTFFIMILLLMADLIWLVMGICYMLQQNQAKYRDDVEPDDGRRKRSQIETGVSNFIVLFLITLLAKGIGENMADYVLHSKEMYDQVTVCDIQTALTDSYRICLEEGYSPKELEKSFALLKMGCMITDWDKPQDVFQSRAADLLMISSFAEIKGKFRTVRGEAQVYVIYQDDTFVVELKNPTPNVKKEIKAVGREGERPPVVP